MAYAKLHFKNPHTGQLRQAPVGFSWTVFFFGFLPSLFRGHWAGAAILIFCALFTLGLSNLVFIFIYNKMFIRHLINEGFVSVDDASKVEFISQKSNLVIPRPSAAPAQ